MQRDSYGGFQMIENTTVEAPTSGDAQMQNNTENTDQKETVSRKPYDGSTKLPRTRADSYETVKSCDGQLNRVELRAPVLIDLHEDAKAKYASASDFESKREIVLDDEKVVMELNELMTYKNALLTHRDELLKADEAMVNEYSFEKLAW